MNMEITILGHLLYSEATANSTALSESLQKSWQKCWPIKAQYFLAKSPSCH